MPSATSHVKEERSLSCSAHRCAPWVLWPGVCLGLTAQYLTLREVMWTRSPLPLASGPETQGGWAGLPDPILHNIFKLVKGEGSGAGGAGACPPRHAPPMTRLFATDGSAALRSVCRSWRRVHDTSVTVFLKPCALHAVALICRFPALEALDLSRCKYPDRADFSAVLGGLPRLASLTLKDAGAGPRFAATLAEALPRARALHSLNLSVNGLATRGATVLADALRAGSCSLTEINFRENQITGAGAVALAAALRHNSSVRTLDLSANPLGFEGAAALSGALVHNCTLERLNLGSCSLGDDGCAALAQGLATFPSLTSLSVYSNGLTDRGAVELASAAGANSNALSALELRGNPGITAVGFEALAEAAEANYAIISIMVDSPRVSGSGGSRRLLLGARTGSAGGGAAAATVAQVGGHASAAGLAPAGAAAAGEDAAGGAEPAAPGAEEVASAREAAAMARLARILEARAMEREARGPPTGARAAAGRAALSRNPAAASSSGATIAVITDDE